MKKIIRAVVFSMLALYATSFWNLGFSYPHDPTSFLKTTLIIALVFFLILPLSKIILIPLNIVTLGLASIIFYFGLLHFLSLYSIVTIKPWDFYGINFSIINIPKFYVSYWLNTFLTALSISTIINFCDTLL